MTILLAHRYEADAHFDHIVFKSPLARNELLAALERIGFPSAAETCIHRWRVDNNVRPRGNKRVRLKYQSLLRMTLASAADHGSVLWLLFIMDRQLGGLVVKTCECAFDFCVATRDESRRLLWWIAARLAKPRSSRKALRVVQPKPDETPAGCVSEHTIYCEDASASVLLKLYVRHPKLPNGGFDLDRFIVRMEWTLKDRSVRRHLWPSHRVEADDVRSGERKPRRIDPIAQTVDLVTADLESFFRHHAVLEEVDAAALSALVAATRRVARPREASSAFAFDHAKRALGTLTLLHAYNSEERLGTDWELVCLLARESPIELRNAIGFRAGRPARRPSAHLLKKCFRPVSVLYGRRLSNGKFRVLLSAELRQEHHNHMAEQK